MEILVVNDSKAQYFMKPQTFNTVAEGERSFKQAVQTPESTFHAFPEDFTLVHIAEFDEKTGEIQVLENPVIVTNGAACLEQPNQN